MSAIHRMAAKLLLCVAFFFTHQFDFFNCNPMYPEVDTPNADGKRFRDPLSLSGNRRNKRPTLAPVPQSEPEDDLDIVLVALILMSFVLISVLIFVVGALVYYYRNGYQKKTIANDAGLVVGPAKETTTSSSASSTATPGKTQLPIKLRIQGEKALAGFRADKPLSYSFEAESKPSAGFTDSSSCSFFSKGTYESNDAKY